MTKPIPPKPSRPDPNECCGGGCVPCILDYYYEALEEWERKYGERQNERAAAVSQSSHSTHSDKPCSKS